MCSTMLRRSILALAALSLFVAAPHAQTPAKVDLAALKTTPEATDYKSTSTYDDVVKRQMCIRDRCQ